MLVATGILLGFVLLVMVGESVQEMQLAGWLPTTPIGIEFPGFVNLWFAAFPTVEGLAAQAPPRRSCSARTSRRSASAARSARAPPLLRSRRTRYRSAAWMLQSSRATPI